MTNNLPKNWTKSSLEEVSTIIMGQSPPSEYYNTEGDGLPFFQGKAEFGDFYPEAVKWCTRPGKIAQKDDVLISVRAPVGPTNLALSECCIGRGLAAIRPKGDIPNKYLLYYLCSIENEIASLGTGTTFKAISGKILKSLSVPIAPLEQQKRIVAEIEKQFSRLDEAVANLKRVKANLKRYKAAVLKAAVEGKLTEEWRKQHPDVEPASKLLERILAERRRKLKGGNKYKEPLEVDVSDLPTLPSGWIWTQIETITDMMSGHAFKKAEYSKKGVRLFQIANVSFGYTKWDEIEHLPDSYIEQWGNLLLKDGDVLMALNRPLLSRELKIVRLGANDVPAILYQRVGKFLFYFEGIADYFLIFMQSPYYINALESQLQGVNIPFINKGKLLSTLIPLPSSIFEMDVIINKVKADLSIIKTTEIEIEKNLKRADGLRQSILHRAFSGQLVPPEPEDEPAGNLLKRIQRQREQNSSPQKIVKKGKLPMVLKDTYFSLDEVEADHLSKILRKNVEAIDPKRLWQESELTIDDFYTQLKREVEGKLIEETKERLLKLIA
ncbi:MAG: restriction endonuclease subunit S [Desulfocapsaceae bacterium]|nr:restriction endonuclease subunit S [Desulfocapsaceae bacterium]